MKILLIYFVEFSDDRSKSPKIYSENCIVGGLDQILNIIITHDETIFSAIDSQ